MAAGRNISSEPIPYTSVGLSRDTLDRVNRLKIAMGRSRSHVIETALSGGGLAGVEAELGEGIRMIGRLASLRGQTWRQLVTQYETKFSGKTYPPTVEQLMTDDERAAIEARMSGAAAIGG